MMQRDPDEMRREPSPGLGRAAADGEAYSC